MYWEVISNERSSLQEYRLIDNNECKVVIKYNPRHQSARITSGSHHRLFYFESAGSLTGKTIFRNEYGMEIGNLVHDKFQLSEGSLVIDNKKFAYKSRNSQSPELVIYENGFQNPVVSCSIPTLKVSVNSIAASKQAIDRNCYLLGLCWYLFLPVQGETSLKYASAGS